MKQSKGNPKGKDAGTTKESTVVSSASASKKFGKYKTEEEKALREQDVKEDEVLKQLKEAWMAFRLEDPWVDEPDNETFLERMEDSYFEALSLIEKMEYSASDVEKFSLALVYFQSEEQFAYKNGIFLSALINNGKDSDYVIHANHLDKKLDFIGFMNVKNITVKGSSRVHAAYLMKDGSMTIEGDGGELLGADMVGGKITVKGNVGDAGSEMMGGEVVIEGDLDRCFEVRGGRIVVHGNFLTEAKFSDNMVQDGEIHVYGEFLGGVSLIGECKSRGKVYHKGELIFGKK